MEKAWQSKEAWKIYKENWKLCHDHVDERDGHKCQIQDCEETENLDLDHCISRDCKATFFELDNLGYLCKSHHTHKSFRKGQWVDHVVKENMRKRCGQKRYDDLLKLSKKSLGGFRTVFYQEKINRFLTKRRG